MIWKLECSKCGKKNLFVDAKEITFVGWKIIAWSVTMGEPIVICKDCKSKNSNKTGKK
jgi:hypothetical protein